MDTNYYISLLIKQYHDKTRARNTISTITQSNCDLYNNIISNMSLAFNVNEAVGEQLDLIGELVGRSRLFEGIEFDDSENPNALDDDTYRTLIKLRIITNYNLNTVYNITQSVYSFFGDKVLFSNGNNMSITYTIVTTSDSNIIKVLNFDKTILPAPAGVQVDYIIEVTDQRFFGFQINGEALNRKTTGFSTNQDLTLGTFLNNNNIL